MRLIRDPRLAAAFIALASAAILGTALASQFFGGLAPCPLCLQQRWPYVATIVLGAVAFAVVRGRAGRRALLALCGVAFAVGGAIAFYHVGVEQGWFAGPETCSGTIGAVRTIEELRRQLLAAPIVRCDEVAWSMFGISMAGYNVIASAILAATSLAAAAQAGRG